MRGVIAGILLLGCASPAVSPATDAMVTDALATDALVTDALVADVARADAGPADTGARIDRPSMDATRDAAPTLDATTIPADVAIDPGMCGPGVRACFCACGASSTCQQGCINRDQDCGFCVYLAATRCCPAQSEVLDRCIDASGCTDDPCIRTRCAGELGAFEGCFASKQRSEPACLRELRGCLGSDHPEIRCVVMR